MTVFGGKIERALTPAQIFKRLQTTQVSGVLTSGVLFTHTGILCDDESEAVYRIELRKGATQRSSRIVTLRHNGITGADATILEKGDYSDVSDTGTVDVTVDGALAGAGVSQSFSPTLLAATSGWSYSIWRLPEKPPQTA